MAALRGHKLPVAWRQRAYAPPERMPSNELDGTQGAMRDVVEASRRGYKIILSPVQLDYSGGWAVGFFIVETYHCSLGSFSSPVEALEIAEQFSSRLPNSLVVGLDYTKSSVTLTPMAASDLAAREIEPRLFHVEGWLPAREVALLNGDGGAGKSLLALQLAVCTALGRRWLGREVLKGRALYISCEDDLDELHRRLFAIATHEGAKLSDLAEVDIVSLAGADALFALPSPDGGVLQETDLFGMLYARVDQSAPSLVVVDTLADVFGGDENIRAQARQFITLMRRLTQPAGSTVLLLSHPSLSGMASGAGTSGSTAWSNSVRSRLYLEREFKPHPYIQGKLVEPDPNIRTIGNKKLNYGPSGSTTRLRWDEAGVFVVDNQPSTAPIAPSPDSRDLQYRAEAKFLELLGHFTIEGRNVTDTPSGTYAPSSFAKDPRAEGIGKKAFAEAMMRLLAAKRIRLEEHGPASRRRSHLALALPAESFEDPPERPAASSDYPFKGAREAS